ncbi:MAG: histidine kinase [Balneola sp.]|nr:histidine kinase [Balneola sp.]MBO6649866.1 histidine kinase [Balneola sp.]MBO6712430.1 histidine kinase [Balneola sp.]MBO6801419.1 histidine kinase [Balneola sp.]MBO6871767.1 histidine kinase [Balneola sp.]
MKKNLHICVWLCSILLISCANEMDERAISFMGIKPYQSVSFTLFETTNNSLGITDILTNEYQNQFDSLKQTKTLEREKTYWFKVNLGDVDFEEQKWVIRAGEYALNNLYFEQEDSIAVSKSGVFDPVEKELELIVWRYHTIKRENLIQDKYVYLELRENYFPTLIYDQQIATIEESDFKSNSVIKFVDDAEYNFRAVFFLGGIAFLLLYTFGIYFIYKDRLYLLYGAYLLFLLLYLGVKMYPAQSTVLFGGLPVLNHAWNEVTQILLNYWYVRFVRRFLDAKNLYPIIDKAGKIIEWIILGFVTAVLISIFSNPLSTSLYAIVTTERIMMIIFALITNIYIVLKLRDRRGLYIVAGSTMLLTGSVTALIMGDIQYFMIGVIVEIFIFGMGLGILMKRREDERTALNKEMEKVKMRALQTQMNPHFIFNSLNSIRSYMIKNETKEASGYLSKFSRLIRQILEYSTEEFITLKEELQVLSLYVQIEQLRFRDEFGFIIEVDESIDEEELVVPPLIVQPFLENAIWHGLMQKKGEKRIELSVKDSGKSLKVVLRDNGIGREEANRGNDGKPKETRSMAIDLTTQRLEMLEEEDRAKEKVTIIDLYDESGQSTGTEVRLEIPKIKRKTK